MKMNNADFNNLQKLIDQRVYTVGIERLRAHYHCLTLDPRVQDITKRFCFDIFYTIPAVVRIPLIDTLYTYINDDNLFTALKKAMCGTLAQVMDNR